MIDRKGYFKLELSTFWGVMMSIIGIILVSVSASVTIYDILKGTVFSMDSIDWLLSTISNLGTGLLAAGILTFSLERFNRLRHREDINDLKSAHSESVLREIIPESILTEIKAHIIQQPFLRSNFEGTIKLAWVDEKHKFLHKSDIATYVVTNYSRTLENYIIRIAEERLNENLFPGSTQIYQIKYQLDEEKEVVYTGSELDSYTNKNKHRIITKIPISLKPEQNLRVFLHVKSILANRDVYLYAITTPTINLDLTIEHPDDLDVRVNPFHPSRHKFKTVISLSSLKTYKLNAGILPFQGVEIMWFPIENNAELKG